MPDRLDAPGLLLVAGDPAVGFAHVLDLEAHAHLDQLWVAPECRGRGTGTALVRAALSWACRSGYPALSLCCYVEPPVPAVGGDASVGSAYYARLGFVVRGDPAPYQRELVTAEQRLGLDRAGPRVVMEAPLRPAR